MTSWLERYQAGEHEAVWQELTALGPSVRDPAHLEAARAVARETMRRVRANLEVLVDRLRDIGYCFQNGEGPLGPVEGAGPLEEFERRWGPLPLSLETFYREVGRVDLCQNWRQIVHYHRPERATADPLLWLGEEDPLQVYPLEWLAQEAAEQAGQQRVCLHLAADEFHKANYSGGENYHLWLPDAGADFVVEGMYGCEEPFVQHLRRCLLGGGFRGRLLLPQGWETEQPTKPLPTQEVCQRLARGLLPV